MLLLQTQWGETVRLLGVTEGTCSGYTHPIPSSPSPLTPWDTDFPALLSGTYSFREEWPHWHLSFILSRWHQSQTKGLGALERERPGEKGPANCYMAQDTFSEMMLISQSITRFAKWFSIPCVICSSHSTRKQVSLLPSYWGERRDCGNSMDLRESREEQTEGPSPGLPCPLHSHHHEPRNQGRWLPHGGMRWYITAHSPFRPG